MQTPCSDYIETKGLVYFARMLDKIRLHARGELPVDYHKNLGAMRAADGACCNFLRINYADLHERVLQGGTDEEILEWCFTQGRRPNEEEIEIWNGFILKRGWRDASSTELESVKKENGFGDRPDLQTWVDFHDADEGRRPGGPQ